MLSSAQRDSNLKEESLVSYTQGVKKLKLLDKSRKKSATGIEIVLLLRA